MLMQGRLTLLYQIVEGIYERKNSGKLIPIQHGILHIFIAAKAHENR